MRRSSIGRVVTCAALLSGLSVSAFQGRFADLISKGIAAIERARFNEAINALEEVWEQDRSDPAVAEHLAMGYLYADADIAKARGLAEYAIEHGGRASFLAQHPHERTGLPFGSPDFCVGRFTIRPGQIAFVANEPAHSFSLEAASIKKLKDGPSHGERRGIFEIHTPKKKYMLRSRSGKAEEAQLVLALVAKYVRN